MLSTARAVTTFVTKPNPENQIPIRDVDSSLGLVIKPSTSSRGLDQERELFLRPEPDGSHSLIWAVEGEGFGRGMIKDLGNHVLFTGDNDDPNFLYKIVNIRNKKISLSFKLKPYTGSDVLLHLRPPVIQTQDTDFSHYNLEHFIAAQKQDFERTKRTNLGGKKKRKKRKSKKNRKTNKRKSKKNRKTNKHRRFSKKLK